MTREEAYRLAMRACEETWNEKTCKQIKEALEKEPKKGHWIIISPTDMCCSECNEIEHLDTSRRFCAYCGMRMVETKESEG
jgi:rRNA maturation endonuclease Nob1